VDHVLENWRRVASLRLCVVTSAAPGRMEHECIELGAGLFTHRHGAPRGKGTGGTNNKEPSLASKGTDGTAAEPTPWGQSRGLTLNGTTSSVDCYWASLALDG
jgi:hypothetical protein